MEDRYIATVDLGTSKIAFTVARVNGEDVQILHYKERPSDGIRHGLLINPAKASVPVKAAIEDAEDELGIKISQVIVGLPRYSIVEESATAKTDRTDPDSCISQEEIDDVKNYALDSYTVEDEKRQEIYGAVVLSYATDGFIQGTEDDIVGVSGETLEGNFKVFVGERKASTNIETMMNKVGIAAARKYFVPDMVARAVLTKDDLNNGVALIEVGAGVSSVTIYRNNVLQHYRSIPFGGRNITWDVKNECGFTERLAENVKYAYGACMPEKLQSLAEKVIQIDNEDGSCDKLPVKYLSEIITARAREIVEALLYDIQESGFGGRLRNGIVLTGGSANLANFSSLIKDMSGLNVRIGYPRGKEFSASGCQGINGTGAVSSLGMILHAKNDIHLNCVQPVDAAGQPEAEPEMTVSKPVTEEEVKKELVDSVFDQNAGIDPEMKQVKHKQKEVKKKEKKDSKVFNWFKETVGNLYDETN